MFLNNNNNNVPIFHHVQLKPKRTRYFFRNLFHGAYTHRRQTERHARFLRCFRSFNLTICMLHTTKSCRSKNQWHGCFFTYNLSRDISVRHVDENFLFETRSTEIALVDSLCIFCPTTAFTVIKEHTRNFSSRNFLHIIDCQNFSHDMVCF